VGLLGARQVGKTTLARQVARRREAPVTFFDLENPRDTGRLAEPMLALEPLRGLVVLDEIHRRPDLFPVLRVLADRRPIRTRFLVLGSASPSLLRQSSETLAGRIAFVNLPGLSLDEVGAAKLSTLWLRGGFPRSLVAKTNAASAEWRRAFVQTFLERDLPQFGLHLPAPTMRRFWTMVAHVHGSVWNSSEFARSFGTADTTVRSYLDALTAAFVVRQLQPWHANLKKRQVKSPKVFVVDSGLLHTLLDLDDLHALEGHPKLGASWEGFAINQIVGHLGVREDQCFFWATHAGAELDLLVVAGNRRWGFEIKRTDAPRVTPSMRSALTDLQLDELTVIHAGRDTFPLGKQIRAVPLSRLADLRPLVRR
jgi:hypothetical protein